MTNEGLMKLSEFAAHIDTVKRGWLPGVGTVVNVTFDLADAEAISAALRQVASPNAEVRTHDRYMAAASPSDREKVARAIHARRYQMNAKDTDSMFAWYAEKPHGTDWSRLAVYSAYKDADAAISALPHQGTETTGAAKASWMPIETAPKDGTPVLVWFRGRQHVAEYSAIWSTENMHWCVRDPATDQSEIVHMVHQIDPPTIDGRPIAGTWLGPTHWMPLPVAPAIPSAHRQCKNCKDPITDALHASGFCGMCREMGCAEPSTSHESPICQKK